MSIEGLVSGGFTAERKYWLNQLSGELQKSGFPYDNIKPDQGLAMDTVTCRLPDEIAALMIKLSNGSDYRLHMIFLAGIAVLLYKYTDIEDIIMGAPIYKQDIEADFINTILPLRIRLARDTTFKELLIGIKKVVTEAVENQNYPMDSLMRELNITSDGMGFPLFGAAVLLQNIHHRKYLDHINPNLIFIYNRFNDKLEGNIEYNAGLYEKATIESMISRLNHLLSIVLKNLDQKAGELELLSETGREQLLHNFNDTRQEYRSDQTIHGLFMEQVAQNPDKVALVFQDQEITYAGLNKKANSLAGILRRKGVKPDDIVGLMAERSLDMIIGVLGILKAGGAYLPVDPGYPRERIQYILEDSQAKFIVIHRHLSSKIHFDGQVIGLEDAIAAWDNEPDVTDINTPDNLAYIIYTSGSTGNPKGVMIAHRGIANLQTFFKTKLGIRETDHIILFASISFDASVWEMFMSLLGGATLYIVPQNVVESNSRFEGFLNQHQITVATLPPTYITTLNPANIKSLRLLVAAGSASTLDSLNKWQDKAEYVNAYGPTETTICATTWSSKNGGTKYNCVPIGKPVSNARIYILSKNNHLQPVGIPGELCVAGDLLARGYLNRLELTREKFVTNPVVPGEMIYRTGDLARWLPDGNIEFLGRLDHQVKIRGHRIELGEIEFQLLTHKLINEAVVIAREIKKGEPAIYAYYTAQQPLSGLEIREYLQQKLPEYLLPAFFVQLETIPLTPNGKVDMKALPDPTQVSAAKTVFETPQNEIQEKLVEIWQDMLSKTPIGINDDFFLLGGDSIKAIQISIKLQECRLKLEMKDLFEYRNIKEISPYVKPLKTVIAQDAVSGNIQLTPVQKWFFGQNFAKPQHFNQAVMLFRKEGFDGAIVAEVFARILETHDALRMVFREENGQIVQINREMDKTQSFFGFEEADLGGDPDYPVKIAAQAEQVQASIDLASGPLVKLKLFKTGNGDHLLIVIHHLVVDAVSFRILFEDFSAGYSQRLENREIQLTEKTHSFKAWSECLYHYADSKKLRKEMAYWNELERFRFKSLPGKQAQEANRLKDSHCLQLFIPEEETAQLLTQVNHPYRTETNDILLAALGMAVKEWAGIDQVFVSLEGHGREEIFEDMNVTRTVGWFTTSFPVVLDMSDPDVGHRLKTVKEYLRHIPNRGIGYGVLKYLSKEPKPAAFEIKPEISFNYLGQFDREVATGVFKISDLPAGTVMSPELERWSILDINALVTDGRLLIRFDYPRNEFDEAAITQLMACYHENLRRIIRHCLGKTGVERTPSDFEDKGLSLEELDQILAMEPEAEKIYSLSPMQEGMLFHSILAETPYAFLEQNVFSFSGSIDPGLFEASFNILLERHEVLRTRFVYREVRQPRQVVVKKRQLTIHVEDISDLEPARRSACIQEFIARDRRHVFDLTRDLLIRLSILKTAADSFKVVWSFHHILMDGWCVGIIIKEFLQIYQSLKNNLPLSMASVAPYHSYIQWLEKQDKDETLNYWGEYLRGYQPGFGLMGFAKANEQNQYRQTETRFVMDETLSKALEDLAAEYHATTNIVFQALWGVMLHRYCNQNDIVFGTITSGRPPELNGIDNMVGLFINTIPVRVRDDGDNSFVQLIMELQQALLSSQNYSYCQLADIRNHTGLKQDLFDHIVIFENYPLTAEVNDQCARWNLGFAIADVQVNEARNTDLQLMILPGREFNLVFSYNSNMYQTELISDLYQNLLYITREIIKNPHQKLADLKTVSEEEQEQLLGDFNQALE